MKRVALLAIAVGLTGCGTIVRGTNEDVAINATPSSAEIQTSNGFRCTGSCVVKVPRKDSFTVTASAPGYQSETVPVQTKFSGGGAAGLAGNVIFGGVIGIGVDAATGATLDHYPNPVVIALEPEGVPQVPVVIEKRPNARPQQAPIS